MLKPFVINKLGCQRQQVILFSDLSCQLSDGEVLLIEGANGSGKSSLLRLLAGLATPASGDILWHNQSIAKSAIEYKQQLHYIGHTSGLRLDLTIAENLAGVMPVKGDFQLSSKTILTQLNLHHKLDVPTRTLSAGQKRKVALANLFLSQKKLWLLDEPLTALDAETQDFFLKKLHEHLQQGGIAVLSSHQPILFNSTVQVIRL